MSPDASGLSGVQKAALLMVALGEEASTQLLKQLEPDEVEKITFEIAKINNAEQDDAINVLQEFMDHAASGTLSGGKNYAERLVEKALGADKRQKFSEKIQDAPNGQLRGVMDADPEHIANFLQDEHVQTTALIIAHLEPGHAAQVLVRLPEESRAEISLRMACLDEISPDVLGRVASILEQKLKTLGDFRRENYGGVRAVADLLNKVDPTMGRGILEELDTKDADVALSVRNLMFVFDDIALLDDKAIREVLKSVDKKDLTVALKGTSQELQDQFFRNMSERAGENLREEMDLAGPVKLKDVEEAQKNIVETVKKLEEDEVISISTGDDEYVL